MSFSSPRHIALALAVAAAVSIEATVPAAASWRDLWPFGRRDAQQEPIPDPVPYEATLEVAGDDRGLRRALTRASNLVESEKTPPSGMSGLVARARDDVSRLTAALYERARYAGEISITIAGRPLETVGPFDPVGATPVEVRIAVDPGPAFVFGAVSASPLPGDMKLEDIGLVPGETAGSADVLQAETEIVNGWRRLGHPLAEARPRDTLADHAAQRLDVALMVDPGPRADFGRVEVNGTERVSPDLVLGRAGIHGGVYSPTRIRYAEERLRDLGVFEGVRIVPGESLDPDGTIPLTIMVTERPLRVIGGSLLYSNTDGFGAEVYWRHRNLFGGAEQLQFSAAVSRVLDDDFDPDFRLAGRFIKPAVFDPMTDFTLRVEAYRETTEAYRVTAAEVEAGFSHYFSDTVIGNAGLELSRFETVNDKDESSDHLVLTLKTGVSWDMRDNRLDPTSGFRALITAEPAYDFIQNTGYATFGGEVSAYRGFGPADRFVLAGRVAGTVIAANDIDDIAPSRRLYAGGAGTVRGYGYMNIAPRDGDGDLEGGLSRLLMSGELRYRINDSFGVVGFVDAGTVSSDTLPDFDNFKVGAGVGLRYLTPVGPIRVDLAVPFQPGSGDPDFAVYVGLGQAF